MASVVRPLWPVATRLSMRSVRPVLSCRNLPAAARPFSVANSRNQLPSPTLRGLLTILLVRVRKYTKEHEWIELSSDKKTGTIGISDYAAHALGDVVYVELPTTPMEVCAGDAIGAVESVKSASDINSPITCTITEVNTLLEEKPDTINKEP